MEKQKLKRCPFCGHKVEIKDHSGDYGYTPSSVSISCDHCNIYFSEDADAWTARKGHFSIREKAIQKLVKKWNTRKGE